MSKLFNYIAGSISIRVTTSGKAGGLGEAAQSGTLEEKERPRIGQTHSFLTCESSKSRSSEP